MDEDNQQKVTQFLPASDATPRIIFRGLNRTALLRNDPCKLDQMLRYITYHYTSTFLPPVLPNMVLRYLQLGGPEAQAVGDLIVELVLDALVKRLKRRGGPRHYILLYILFSHRQFTSRVVPKQLGGFDKFLIHNEYPMTATVSEIVEVLCSLRCDSLRHIGVRTLQHNILYYIERQENFHEWWNPREYEIVVEVWTFPGLEDAWDIIGRSASAQAMRRPSARPVEEAPQPRETQLRRKVSVLARKVSKKVRMMEAKLDAILQSTIA